MRTYTVLYAEDVPHYGTREFEAADDDPALQRAIDITRDAMSTFTQVATTIPLISPAVAGLKGIAIVWVGERLADILTGYGISSRP
jgi:hypothetical protein